MKDAVAFLRNLARQCDRAGRANVKACRRELRYQGDPRMAGWLSGRAEVYYEMVDRLREKASELAAKKR